MRCATSIIIALAAVAGVAAAVPVSSASFTDLDDNLGNTFASDALDSASTLSATTGTSISLSWTPTSDAYATGHRIYRAEASGGPYTAVATLSPRSTVSFVDTPAPGDYYYVVRAVAGGWESAPTNEAAATRLDPGTADAGGPYAIAEGDTLVLDGSASLGAVSWAWDLDGDLLYDDALGVAPAVTWSDLEAAGINDDGSFVIGLQINGDGDTTTTTVTVTNTEPNLVVAGSATTPAGSSYVLDLSALDPGDDTISSWTVNWGDGSIETIVGSPSSVTHVYANAGFTYGVLVSATDEDGSYVQNDLIVPAYSGDSVFGIDGQDGTVLSSASSADDPIEAVISPAGRLFVTGERSSNVLEHAPNAQSVDLIGTFVPSGGGGLIEGGGAAFGSDGNLYVSDFGGDRVLVYDGVTGAPLGTHVSGVDRPYDVVVGPDGALYVGLYARNEVVRINPVSGQVEPFVARDSGGLDKPEQMAFGPDGNLYVASYRSDEVLRFDGTTGDFIDVFIDEDGNSDDAAFEDVLQLPTGLAFGPDGLLYVANSSRSSILRFDPSDGRYLDEFVGGGLNEPTLMTFVAEHRVTVTDDGESP